MLSNDQALDKINSEEPHNHLIHENSFIIINGVPFLKQESRNLLNKLFLDQGNPNKIDERKLQVNESASKDYNEPSFIKQYEDIFEDDQYVEKRDLFVVDNVNFKCGEDSKGANFIDEVDDNFRFDSYISHPSSLKAIKNYNSIYKNCKIFYPYMDPSKLHVCQKNQTKVVINPQTFKGRNSKPLPK